MRRFRKGICRVLPWGLGWAVVGCQAPDGKPAGIHHPSVSLRASASVAPKPNAKSLVKNTSVHQGLEPADSLSACRPLRDPQAISVARFLEELQTLENSVQDPSAKPSDRTQANEDVFPIPQNMPGANVPPVTVPQRNPDEPFETHRQRVRSAYAKLPPLPPVPFSPDDVAKERISLAELQEIALTNSPVIAAAAAKVEQARGEALQAGLYPNPMAGYQADTVNTGDTAGYHGVYASQEIVTADKLKIAQSRASQEVAVAELELRRAQIDLATAVRRQYFQALIAQERLIFARALMKLFVQRYDSQIDLVAAGESAAHQPLQSRVFALEARNSAIMAGNDYVAAWRALGAVLNTLLTPRQLDGSPEMPVPEISYEAALDLLLARHTDLAIAQTRIARSEWNLWLQRVSPIPNVHLAGVVQYDDTTSLNDVSFNLQVGVPLPVFDKNQGNIYSAQSQILENHERLQQAQNELTARLAEVYARYETQTELAEAFRQEILPDQVRTYQGVAQGFRAGEGVDIAQVVVTQQQIWVVVGEYITVLEAQWLAIVELAELLQADDLFSLDRSEAHGLEPGDDKPLLVPIPEPKESPK